MDLLLGLRKITVQWCFDCGEMRHTAHCADCGARTEPVSFVREADVTLELLGLVEGIREMLKALVDLRMLNPSYVTTLDVMIESMGGGSEG